MVQLQNQDPMNPMDDSAFLAQMAQFTTLEQITNLAQEMTTLSLSSQVSQATGLIGHPVTYLAADGTKASGVVSGVSVSGSNVQLQIGSSTVGLSQVESIEPVPQPAAPDPATLAAQIAAALAAGSSPAAGTQTATGGTSSTTTSGGTTATSGTSSTTTSGGTTATSGTSSPTTTSTSPTTTSTSSGTSTGSTTGTAQDRKSVV